MESKKTTQPTPRIIESNLTMEAAINADAIDQPLRDPMNFSKAVSNLDYDRRQTVHRVADLLSSEMRYNDDPRIRQAYGELIAAADAMYAATKTLRALAAVHDQKPD